MKVLCEESAQTPTPERRRPGKSRIQNPGPPPADPGRPLLHTTEIPIFVIAYKGNPYMCYCVQWKSNSPDADPGPPPAGEIPNPKPRTAAGRPRTAVTAYDGKSLYALLLTMENHQPRRRPRTAAGREDPQSKSPDRRRPEKSPIQIPTCCVDCCCFKGSRS